MFRLGSTTARLKLKGIDGETHNQRAMWFNSIRNDKPYLALTCYRLFPWKQGEIRKDGSTDVAWLLSVRVVRRRFKYRNERNPCCMLNIHTGLPWFIPGRKEGTTSSHHGSYGQGYTHGVMGGTTGREGVIRS